MQDYIKKLDWTEYEVEILVDWKIFSEDVILKAAYELIDKANMHFRSEWDDYYVKLKSKSEKINIDKIIELFEEELIYHRLRRDIDAKAWDLRQKIVETALGYWLTVDDIKEDIYKISSLNAESNQENFEGEWNYEPNEAKTVEDIIWDIQNDPEFSDDRDEIISILKEIQS